MILLRTERVDSALEAIASELERLSGLPTLFLVDECRGPIDTGTRGKISVTRAACNRLGLYCPDDFAWRCGDYGFYLGRAAHPAAANIWMIENDVRIAGTDAAALFRKFQDVSVDLIASHVETPENDWPWTKTLQARDTAPIKCFFPVVRLSARAIDLLAEKRRQHSRQWYRRWLWPNDEGFVATTLLHAGGTTMDLNDGAPQVYRTDEFTFAPVRDSAVPLESDGPVALFHPVLEGDALLRKQQKLLARQNPKWTLERVRRRAREATLRRLNRRMNW